MEDFSYVAIVCEVDGCEETFNVDGAAYRSDMKVYCAEHRRLT